MTKAGIAPLFPGVLRANKIFDRFTPEHQFHPERNWRFDWADLQNRIAVELHGAVWTQGGHTRGGGFVKDREKMNEAQVMGWIVLELASPEHLAQFPEWYARALELRQNIPFKISGIVKA